MKSNFFCIILACTAFTLVGQQSTNDILEDFLSKDLLFRKTCINNDEDVNCTRIRDAIFTQYTYGRAIRYLENNKKHLITEYDKQMNPHTKRSFIPFSSRNPKIKSTYDALIIKYVSEEIFADKDINELLIAAATTLIIQSTTDQPDIDQGKQLTLLQQSLNRALNDQREEEI
jgi:hypothetical protein